jgi:hypothetical protein
VPVTDRQSWDVGIVDHLIYLEKSPAKVGGNVIELTASDDWLTVK